MQRLGAVVIAEHVDGGPVLDQHLLEALRHVQQDRRVCRPIHLGGGVLAHGVRAQACTALHRAGRAKTHLGADQRAPGALDQVIGVFPRQIELGASVGGERAGLHQLTAQLGLLQAPKNRHHVVVEVVVDLAMAAWLLKQNAGRAAEGLGVDAVRGEEAHHPRGQSELAAVVAHCRAGNGHRSITSTSCARRLPDWMARTRRSVRRCARMMVRAGICSTRSL